MRESAFKHQVRMRDPQGAAYTLTDAAQASSVESILSAAQASITAGASSSSDSRDLGDRITSRADGVWETVTSGADGAWVTVTSAAPSVWSEGTQRVASVWGEATEGAYLRLRDHTPPTSVDWLRAQLLLASSTGTKTPRPVSPLRRPSSPVFALQPSPSVLAASPYLRRDVLSYIVSSGFSARNDM